MRRVLAAMGAMAVLLPGPVARAAEGDLDASFGSGGKIVTALSSGSDQINGLALDGSGRVVAAGWTTNITQVAIARYGTTGTLDPSFGTDGIVKTSTGTNANGVTVDGSGRVVVAGQYGTQLYVARFTDNGGLDSGFGSGGFVVTSVGDVRDELGAVTIDGAGRVLVAGLTQSTGPVVKFLVMRFLTDGKPDPGFGINGIVTTALGGSGIAQGMAIALDSQGRIVVGGVARDPDSRFALARYTPGGDLDGSFGSGGRVLTPIGGNAGIRSLAIDAQDRVVVGGLGFNGSNADFAVARYGADGVLDGSFASGGIALTAIGSANDQADDVAIDPQGRIVASGQTTVNGGYTDFAVVRYLSDGSLDPAFGLGGKITTQIGATNAVGYGLTIDRQSRILVGGQTTISNSDTDFALARYVGDQVPPTISIDSGPAEGGFTNDATPDFGFSSNDPLASFACAFDGLGAACGSPFAPAARLADGPHSFALSATDPAGNGSAPITRSFTVDTVAPDVAIRSGPRNGAFTRNARPTFAFGSSDTAAGFACGFDGARSACASPFTPAQRLSNGRHSFAVTAIDRAGNASAPTLRTIRVDTRKPRLKIRGPSRLLRPGRLTLRLVTNEPAKLRCRLDGGRQRRCSKRYRTRVLGAGRHVVHVTATDRAGNRSKRVKRIRVG